MRNILHILKIFLIFATWIGWSSYQPIRGKSIAPSTSLMIDYTKRIDKMSKRKTLEQVLNELNNVHNERYGYELVNEENYYKNTSVIPVVCKKHNIVFPIRVANHLHGQGCPLCANEKRRQSNTGNVRKRTKLVWGVGINDYEGNIKSNHVHIPSYHTWEQMLKRCYSQEFLNSHSTYKGCSVCDEWKYFSNFKRWFDKNYVDGYQLDKDIIKKGNKVYSPDTCCFVPLEINTLLCKSDKARGEMPIGVYKREMVHGYKYVAYLNNSIKKHFHLGTFETPEEAFLAYKKAKEVHIKDIATKYFQDGKITESVYNALMNYKVEITD